MKKIILVIATLFSITSLAADKDFDWIKPFDQKITDTLVWNNEGMAANISDYTQMTMSFAPFLTAIGKDDGWERVGALGAAHLTSALLTRGAKEYFDRVRPNGQGERSFWSGHTSASFVSAGYLCAYEKKYCVAGLILASTTGYLRIAGRRHWFTDVVVGAAVGYMAGRHIPLVVMSF